ncbi:MAG TPA: PTS sugar transporter subunit IIA [bacterium]|nr:PTS sugar transporter subunit IIA [bacterium]
MDSGIGIIVATHGQLAESLVETAGLILQRPSGLTAFTFVAHEDPKAASRRLQSLIKKCDHGQGVIILVDLFGGTPGNLALSLLQDASVEVVTGVNLPMAVAAANLDPNQQLEQATAALEQAGRNAIKGAGLLLRSG